MKNKYYTPKITDLRVGYECEVFGQTSTKLIKNLDFHKVTIGLHQEIPNKVGITQVSNLIKKGWIRVPFLTKDQIESEGWVLEKEFESIPTFKKGKAWLVFWEQQIPYVEIYKEEGYDTQYQGDCPSINEFRYICSLLKI